MTNEEILKKEMRNQNAVSILYEDNGQQGTLKSAKNIVLDAMDAAREDEAGKWEAQLKAERERAGKLMEAAEQISHLHACEQEGLSSGQPTPAQWFDATIQLSEAINEYNNKP